MDCSCIDKDKEMKASMKTHVVITRAHLPRSSYIACELLDAGIPVKALVDNPFSEVAQKLADKGCMVVKGSIAKADKLWLALNGCFAAICVLDPFEMAKDYSEQDIQGYVSEFAEKCRVRGMSQFILCDGGVDRATIQKIQALKFRHFNVIRYPEICYEDFVTCFQFEKKESGNLLRLNLNKKEKLITFCAKDLAPKFVDLIQTPGKFTVGEAFIKPRTEWMPIEDYINIITAETHYNLTYESVPADEPDLPNANLTAYFEAYKKRQVKGRREGKRGSATGRSFRAYVKDHKLGFRLRITARLTNSEKNNKMIKDFEEQNKILKETETETLIKQLKRASPDACEESLRHTANSIVEMRMKELITKNFSSTAPSGLRMNANSLSEHDLKEHCQSMNEKKATPNDAQVPCEAPVVGAIHSLANTVVDR
mmetsp:Transcript_14687/g.20559  ORF Transcript_14687/g.20559 Transcript_14687/m.20559 type:complete len:426 (-) Transcript_14687:3-1280(-)